MNLIDAVFPSLEDTVSTLLKNRINSLSDRLEQDSIHLDLTSDIEKDLIKVLLYSEFIASAFVRNPSLLNHLLGSGDLEKSFTAGSYESRVTRQTAECRDQLSQLKETLLKIKQYEIIRIAWRDLTEKADTKETLADLSGLADALVRKAFSAVYDDITRQYGLPVDAEGNFQGIIVLGMGKLGARELNFSSDIDLIFAYLEDGYTNGEQMISNNEFFTTLCRKFLKLFSAGSHELLFYRIDTRLRPYGESGPLVMSSAALEEYYQAQGREWERYALIKARPIAGDIEAGNKVLKRLNSFIYRRYFDYGSFDSFREMKHRITLQVKSKKLESNIKLGAGGIREIEFFGQLFQLIRGGVAPDLQERQILQVLDLLVQHDCIPQATCDDLTQDYLFLRKVENRLQEYADRQTHDIPKDPLQRQILTLAMGMETFPDFKKILQRCLDRVHYHFSQLLVTEDQETPDPETSRLKQMWGNINDPQIRADSVALEGFTDQERVLSILRALEQHPHTKQLTTNGRNKLARLVPVLVRKIGTQQDPEVILGRLIDLIIAIERRTCYLSLLIESNSALETLITLARKSPWIISFLSRHPALLDELLHPATLYAPPGQAALQKEMAQRMAQIPKGNIEFMIEELCVFRQINTLRVSAADVSGNYPLMKVSDHLTYIAQTVLTQVLKMAWDIVTEKYGAPQNASTDNLDGCGFAIIAYGKVGGYEMGYKSDLDIVFLFDAEQGTTSGTAKQIDNILFYSNIGQRIIHVLTMHTPAGTLYGADMRLRPGGTSGPLVSHIEAFEDYMENRAWTWEHQAMIRSRPIAGDKALGQRFLQIREKILTGDRDDQRLKPEVADMRERIRNEKLKVSPDEFDLKQSAGAIVDIEFLVQYLVLKHAAQFPDIIYWTDNVRLLESLEEEGIIDACESERLQQSYVHLRKAIHRLNLEEKTSVVPVEKYQTIRDHVVKIYETYLSGS